jgi:hypothetical protein
VALVVATGAILLGVYLLSSGPTAFSGKGPTRLTIVAGRQVFHLRCNPPRGSLPHPAQACAAITAHPALVTSPKPFECDAKNLLIRISGRVHKEPEPISTTVVGCSMPTTQLLNKLGLHPPQR